MISIVGAVLILPLGQHLLVLELRHALLSKRLKPIIYCHTKYHTMSPHYLHSPLLLAIPTILYLLISNSPQGTGVTKLYENGNPTTLCW